MYPHSPTSPGVPVRSTRVFSSQSRSKKAETATVTFVLLKEDREELVRIASELGLSISGICREALHDYLQRASSDCSDTNVLVGE